MAKRESEVPSIPFPRGSEWRKWDLHIHSPLSILNNGFPMLEGGHPDWPSYLDGLESSDMAVVGITDYFTIDGYKEVRRFQQEEGRLAGIRLLPNIEFRLNKIVSRGASGGDKRLTLHVLFSDEVEPIDIEEHFLNNIDFVYEGHPQEPGHTLKLKAANLERLGERLKAENDDFHGTALQVGATTAIVDDKDICTLLAGDPRFTGKYLVALADENLSDVTWTGQGHVVRQTLLQRAGLVFGPNPKTVQWCLGKDPYAEGPEAFVREFKSLKPCIHGSDAHELDRIGVPCARRGEAEHVCSPDADCDLRYCWIKADPTFEGLRQILYEPEARVRIQADDPTPIRSSHSLARFVASETPVNDDLTVAAIDLPLNQGLVAVAGGKGSGKTALLDLIAHSFSDRRLVQNKNSFVRRIAEDEPEMALSLTFADGTGFGKRVLEPSVCDSGQITYIAQGELEERIADKEGLGAHIRDLVLGSPQVKDGVRTFELREVEGRISSNRTALERLHEKIQSLEDQTDKSIESEISQSEQMLRTEVGDAQARITAIEKRVGEVRAQKAKDTQGKLSELEKTRDLLLEVRVAVEEVEAFAAEALPRAIAVVTTVNSKLEELDLGVSLTAPSPYPPDELPAAQAAVSTHLKDTISAIEVASAELASFEEGIRDHAGLLRLKTETEGKLADLEKQRTEVKDLRQELTALRTRRRELGQQLQDDKITQRDIYADLFDTFAQNKQRVLSDVRFTPEVFYDRPGFEEAVSTVVDGRQVRNLTDELKGVHAAYSKLAKGESADVEPVLKAIETLSESLAGKLKASRALKRATLYRVLWDDYLTVRPTVRYKGATLDRLSLGQKATVLVKVYLAQGTTPIIIDSQDEHMDNEFIMHELVGALREAKEYRQVIIASNNGNVVVNSDAEQVILANFSDGRISYFSGSLEEPAVRDAALRVLEGGAEAFRRRREKYRVRT